MRHKVRLFSVLIVSLTCLVLDHTVTADVLNQPSPSVTIMKRTSVSSSATVTQTTSPLARVHYLLTRILPVERKTIVATDPTTYTIASGEQGFTTELVTDDNGQVVYDDAAKLTDGTYLLEELKGYGVDTTADPVVFTLPFTDATGQVSDDFIYEPKSGLSDISGNSQTNHPGINDSNGSGVNSGVNVGASDKKQTVIMQTSGSVWSISLLSIFFALGGFLSALMGGLVILRKYLGRGKV
ncbi:MAG: prealbumin-like fold domain-containing protein [Enterococcus faecium]|uniref:prealbumin-like fold domain-containing protein n=1 Tax=Enterococcus faecium TaxID=1352 RepID=UPI000F61F82D|nr:prealbumin-like fold domain-containing protein [Enterococcus faecium]RRG14888.1 hypothetical protein CQ403_13515 [Enterococcus faecium]